VSASSAIKRIDFKSVFAKRRVFYIRKLLTAPGRPLARWNGTRLNIGSLFWNLKHNKVFRKSRSVDLKGLSYEIDFENVDEN
jgi:hypothetical protein